MKIEIKKSNRGKFTETKKRTGKTTEELTHSKNPLTKKRAIFAQNSKHFKHGENGFTLEDGTYDLSQDEINHYKSMGYNIEEL